VVWAKSGAICDDISRGLIMALVVSCVKSAEGGDGNIGDTVCDDVTRDSGTIGTKCNDVGLGGGTGGAVCNDGSCEWCCW
jgi:hypothetical protein